MTPTQRKLKTRKLEHPTKTLKAGGQWFSICQLYVSTRILRKKTTLHCIPKPKAQDRQASPATFIGDDRRPVRSFESGKANLVGLAGNQGIEPLYNPYTMFPLFLTEPQ